MDFDNDNDARGDVYEADYADYIASLEAAGDPADDEAEEIGF